MVFVGGLVLLMLSVLWAFFPRILAVPGAVLGAWLAVSLLWKAWRLRKPPQTGSPASLPIGIDGTTSVPPTAAARSTASLPGDAAG
jgi:hypothetical protein